MVPEILLRFTNPGDKYRVAPISGMLRVDFGKLSKKDDENDPQGYGKLLTQSLLEDNHLRSLVDRKLGQLDKILEPEPPNDWSKAHDGGPRTVLRDDVLLEE